MSPPKRELRMITLSIRLYHWLLRLGPREFLQEYEEMILLDFRQHCHNAYKQRGPFGVLCLWPPLFASAIFDMSVERISVTYKGKQERPSWSKELTQLYTAEELDVVREVLVLGGVLVEVLVVIAGVVVVGGLTGLVAGVVVAGLLLVSVNTLLKKRKINKKSTVN